MVLETVETLGGGNLVKCLIDGVVGGSDLGGAGHHAVCEQ